MPTVCLARCQLLLAASQPHAAGEAGGWRCLAALKGKICAYITQSILYLFWILSSDIKAADINLQGQTLALMDPVTVLMDGSLPVTGPKPPPPSILWTITID